MQETAIKPEPTQKAYIGPWTQVFDDSRSNIPTSALNFWNAFRFYRKSSIPRRQNAQSLQPYTWLRKFIQSQDPNQGKYRADISETPSAEERSIIPTLSSLQHPFSDSSELCRWAGVGGQKKTQLQCAAIRVRPHHLLQCTTKP